MTFEEFITTVHFKASPDYLLREIAGESVLIPIGESSENSNRMFSLNESCTYLWKAFQEERTTKDVINEALEIYDATEEELTRDIFSFVRDYHQLGMLLSDLSEQEAKNHATT